MYLLVKKQDGSLMLCKELAQDASYLVGRSPENDIQLRDTFVSRRHAKLVMVNGQCFVVDEGSTGGTKVNGKRIAEMTPFEIGDLAAIASYRLELTEEAPELPPGVGAPNSLNGPNADPDVTGRVAGPTPEPQAAPVAETNNFLDEFRDASVLYSDDVMRLTRRLHEDILNKLNVSEDTLISAGNSELMDRLETYLDSTLNEHRHELPIDIKLDVFRNALKDELVGYGPITPMLRSPRVSEIMINGPQTVFVESKGVLYNSGVRFFSGQHLLSIIQRIVEPLGRHIDDASPMVDARLPDGSRVNAVIPPLALDGASVTIRKFSDKALTTDDLIEFGSITKEMGLFLQEAVRARKNIIVSGGTGSGKTTLLNILSLFIPSGERVITIEDSAELKLTHTNLVRLEARPANIEGKGRISIRDLVINTLRMRPDRIIVGECRGAEALDMLQAMNTGHDGSLTTCHANSPRDALSRLENMVMMAGFDLPSSAIREQITAAVDLIVQQTRLPDGTRKVVAITEITGKDRDVIQMQDIFQYVQTGITRDEQGRTHVEGYHTATGNIPTFVEEMRQNGSLNLDMGVFVPHF